MSLPKKFLQRMQKLLASDYDAFIQSYEKPLCQALRVNTLKISTADFLKLSRFELAPVPWVSEGFFYKAEDRPGKHPYHEAGLYYIQEPSAMAVGTLAQVHPGDRVLDLCAAPGGKSSQLAAYLKGEGLLVANEIHPTRAKILSRNIERMGIRNAIVTNETPAVLAKRFPDYFDCIVVDAPCSGEGMFRNKEQASEQWSLDHVTMCALRQQEILSHAAAMLKPQGRLVYSTCTFAPEENEGTVCAFLDAHTDFEIERSDAYKGFDQGRPQWVNGRLEVLETFRLWPHKIDGEGHYIAVLRKKGICFPSSFIEKTKAVDQKSWNLFLDFAKENLKTRFEGHPVLFKDQLYLLPCAISLDGLRVLRSGLHLGTCKKGRFEPSFALVLALCTSDVKNRVDLKCEDLRTTAYLRGETFACDDSFGWCLVTVDGYSLGWGKVSNGQLKNHFPKGLRWL